MRKGGQSSLEAPDITPSASQALVVPSLSAPTPLHTCLSLVSASLSSLPLNPCLPPCLCLSIYTAFYLVSLCFHLSLCSLSLSLSDPLGHAFNRCTDTVRVPPPCDLCPSPTALSDFLSFKRHINYSNEVRRDPASAIWSQEHPPAWLPPAHPSGEGKGAPCFQAPVPVSTCQLHCSPCISVK